MRDYFSVLLVLDMPFLLNFLRSILFVVFFYIEMYSFHIYKIHKLIEVPILTPVCFKLTSMTYKKDNRSIKLGEGHKFLSFCWFSCFLIDFVC